MICDDDQHGIDGVSNDRFALLSTQQGLTWHSGSFQAVAKNTESKGAQGGPGAGLRMPSLQLCLKTILLHDGAKKAGLLSVWPRVMCSKVHVHGRYVRQRLKLCCEE